MILLNGITGFNNSKNGPPSKKNEKQFKQVCFTILSNIDGKLLFFKEARYPRNFHEVHIEFRGMNFYILLNEYYPSLAFASHVEFGEIHFIDVMELYKEFSYFYNVLTSKALNEPLQIQYINKAIIIHNDNQLNNAELEQIAFWKPMRVGDVIFNYWD